MNAKVKGVFHNLNDKVPHYRFIHKGPCPFCRKSYLYRCNEKVIFLNINISMQLTYSGKPSLVGSTKSLVSMNVKNIKQVFSHSVKKSYN